MRTLGSLRLVQDLEDWLTCLPPTLDSSYLAIWKEIEDSDIDSAKLARKCFQWLLIADYHLSSEDVAVLISEGRPEPFTSENIVQACHYLVEEGQGRLRFPHVSVREFFEAATANGLEGFSLDDCHAAIASCCLRYLACTRSAERLKKADIFHGSSTNQTLVIYASGKWPFHYSMSGSMRNRLPLKEQISTFIVPSGLTESSYKRWCYLILHTRGEWTRVMTHWEHYVLKMIAKIPDCPIPLLEEFNLLEHEKFRFSDQLDDEDKATWLAHAVQRRLLGWIFHLLYQGAVPNPQALAALITHSHPRIDYKTICLFMTRLGVTFPYDTLSAALTDATIDQSSAEVATLTASGTQVKNDAIAWKLSKDDVSAAKWLINHGFDVNATSENSWTALHWSAVRRYLGVMTRLVEKGASLSVGDSSGQMPLHIAAAAGHADAVEELLALGADPNARRLDQSTAMHLALRKGNIRGYRQIIDCLTKNGASLHARDGDGNTPLHIAMSEGNHSIIGALLNLNTSMIARNAKGRTPLHLAALKDNPEVVEAIIIWLRTPTGPITHAIRARSLDAADNDLNTPLHLAVLEGRAASVNTLVRFRANVLRKNNRGRTPLHEALLGKFYESSLALLAAAPMDISVMLEADDSHQTPLDLARNWRCEDGSCVFMGKTIFHNQQGVFIMGAIRQVGMILL